MRRFPAYLEKRDKLIDTLERRLSQRLRRNLFAVHWRVE